MRFCAVPTTGEGVSTGASDGREQRRRRGRHGELAEPEAAAAGRHDRAVAHPQHGRVEAQLRRRRGDHAPAEGRGGGLDRPVDRADGVGPAGELVGEQVGTGVGERHPHLRQRQAQLVGDEHGHGRRDALADLLAGQGAGHRAVALGDEDDEPALRRLAGQDQDVAEVLQVGRLRRAGQGVGGAAEQPGVDGHGQRRPGDEEGEELPPADAVVRSRRRRRTGRRGCSRGCS